MQIRTSTFLFNFLHFRILVTRHLSIKNERKKERKYFYIYTLHCFLLLLIPFFSFFSFLFHNFSPTLS